MEDYKYDLGDLASSLSNQNNLNIRGISPRDLNTFLKKMLLIREAERLIAFNKKEGLIRGPVHLSAGQEAVAVGVSKYLGKNDNVFGTHRSHAHLLALGSNPLNLFAEILGKSNGISKGMGGSMHLIDKNVGFQGAVPIVGGTISLAVGAALAEKLSKRKNIAVAYFGDGASEEGIFHESLNLASILECPVLFVCENNLFSSHLNIKLRQPHNSIARFAAVNNIKSKIVDGNNILDVKNASKELINFSRNYSKPTFLEAVTYRFFGHVDWREDIDVGLDRSKDDLQNWKKKDPILRLYKAMIENNLISNKEFIDMENRIKEKLISDWEEAFKGDYPTSEDHNKFVFFSNKNSE